MVVFLFNWPVFGFRFRFSPFNGRFCPCAFCLLVLVFRDLFLGFRCSAGVCGECPAMCSASNASAFSERYREVNMESSRAHPRPPLWLRGP